MTIVRQNILSIVMLKKMTSFPMEMSDCIWQNQKHANPETPRITVNHLIFIIVFNISPQLSSNIFALKIFVNALGCAPGKRNP